MIPTLHRQPAYLLAERTRDLLRAVLLRRARAGEVAELAARLEPLRASLEKREGEAR